MLLIEREGIRGVRLSNILQPVLNLYQQPASPACSQFTEWVWFYRWEWQGGCGLSPSQGTVAGKQEESQEKERRKVVTVLLSSLYSVIFYCNYWCDN